MSKYLHGAAVVVLVAFAAALGFRVWLHVHDSEVVSRQAYADSVRVVNAALAADTKRQHGTDTVRAGTDTLYLQARGHADTAARHAIAERDSLKAWIAAHPNAAVDPGRVVAVLGRDSTALRACQISDSSNGARVTACDQQRAAAASTITDLRRRLALEQTRPGPVAAKRWTWEVAPGFDVQARTLTVAAGTDLRLLNWLSLRAALQYNPADTAHLRGIVSLPITFR